MIRIALVGDIGSGKTFISTLFKYPIFNADKEVEKIYRNNKKCYFRIKKKLPKYFSKFPLKKQELVNSILSNKKNLKVITNIVHPIIKKKLNYFLKKNKLKKIVILDIPLFFENSLNRKGDYIIFIKSKKKKILREIKKRKGYNKKLLDQFRKIQLPLEIKKRKSNFIINNDFKKITAKKYVKKILKQIYERNSFRYRNNRSSSKRRS